MNINSFSNTNAQAPAFGALKKDAVKVFQRKMALDTAGQNEVYKELINFARRAQESDVLDVASAEDKVQRGENLLAFEYNNNGTYGGYVMVPLDFDSFQKNSDGEVVAVSKESPRYTCFKHKNGRYEAPIKEFFETFTALFDHTEAERLKELDINKEHEALLSQLDKFTK